MLWRDDAVKLKQLVNDYTEYQRLIEEYKQVDVLYIDDLFKSQSGAEPTKADINIAFELLNNRLMDKGKITVISSEFSILDALQFDEATIGRIYQHTGQYKIEIPKDIRKNYRLRG
jgi:DNA replication protein DnaC